MILCFEQAKSTDDGKSEDSAKATASKSSQDMGLKSGESDPCIQPGSLADTKDSLGQQVDEKSVETANDKSNLENSESDQNISKSDAIVSESANQIN